LPVTDEENQKILALLVVGTKKNIIFVEDEIQISNNWYDDRRITKS
jgi:hypothetical protein